MRILFINISLVAINNENIDITQFLLRIKIVRNNSKPFLIKVYRDFGMLPILTTGINFWVVSVVFAESQEYPKRVFPLVVLQMEEDY
jgi:hypothetical protein